MKAQLKKRPQSTKIRTTSGNITRRANPAVGEDYFKKGKVEQLAGNHKRAIELYTLATACKTNYFQAYCNMGYCYRAMGKFGEAKRSYQSALFSNPQDPISHFNLANLYRVIGENELAIEEYSQVIALKKEGVNVGNLYLDSLVNIGICYKNRREIDEAIKVNRKVLQIQPNQPSATFNLAICLLNSIQDKNTPLFHKFYHQRATQAEGLFLNILRKDPDSIMAQFCLNKVSAILDPSHTNLEAMIIKQKELLDNPRCDIKDEINQQIARCLNLQKKYGQSAKYYESSVSGISRRGSRSKKQPQNKIDNIFETFSHQNISQNGDFLTEAEGIALIQSGQLKKAGQRISKLSDGLLKQTLQLILQLKKSEIEPNNTGNAFAIYQLYFNKNQIELPFDKISVQAHKAIGKVLSLQQNYEKSIKHYEYISQKIKDNRSCASAKLHSQLGERFEQVGNRQKALEQYKKGMQIQPDNYSLSYSMGYCLFENGSYQQAKACFDKIIQRIRADTSLPTQTKELYLTDCMIICALCTTQHSLDTFNLFSDAFRQFQKLQQSKEGSIQMEEENLLLFFIRVSQLYEQKIIETTPDDPRYKESASMLISIYQEILELNCCPDRNQILVNSGTLSYQLGNYATAAVAYSQITTPQMIPALNLALTYAHLIEPSLALKYVQQASQMEDKDITTNFCREMLQWMYFNAHDGEWNKHLPNYKQDLFYERNQYGLGLIDKLSEAINSPDFQSKGLQKLLQILVKHQQRIKSKNSVINHKFQILQELQKKYDFKAPSSSGSMLSPQILKLCFSKSSNIHGDFIKLVQLLQGIPKSGQESYFIEAAIYLFIFSNQTDNQNIHQLLIKMAQRKRQYGSINSTFVQQNDKIYSIYPDFKSLKELIAVLRQWETVLERSTRETLNILEEIYYKGNIRQPFEIQYHFPRNYNLLEEDETFQKVIAIALNVIKYTKNLVCRGNNIKQLRNDLIKDFETQFSRFLKSNTLHPIFISQSFLPITLYAVHQSKQDCQHFLNEIAKRFKVPQIILHDCEQAIIVINKLIKLRCKWNNPYEVSEILHEVIDNIVENPLFIVNQAIIYLQSIIPILKKDSAQAKKYISMASTLNF